MASSEKPYGGINSFPAISPITIMLFAYKGGAFFGKQTSETTHEAIVATATIFTYGLIPLTFISYVTFKYFILPASNYLPSKIQIKSHFVNVIIIILIMEMFFALLFVLYQGFEGLTRKFLVAAIPTALTAINCLGHIFFKFESEMKPNV
jgi:hypothetical protein